MWWCENINDIYSFNKFLIRLIHGLDSGWFLNSLFSYLFFQKSWSVYLRENKELDWKEAVFRNLTGRYVTWDNWIRWVVLILQISLKKMNGSEKRSQMSGSSSVEWFWLVIYEEHTHTRGERGGKEEPKSAPAVPISCTCWLCSYLRLFLTMMERFSYIFSPLLAYTLTHPFFPGEEQSLISKREKLSRWTCCNSCARACRTRLSSYLDISRDTPIPHFLPSRQWIIGGRTRWWADFLRGTSKLNAVLR